MKKIVVFMMAIGLVACGEQAKLEDAIRRHLNDPKSAQFGDVLMGKKKNIACIEWNAKNRMGGYGDWKVAIVVKDEGERDWVVQNMEVKDSELYQCKQKELDEYVSLKDWSKRIENWGR